MSYVDIAHEGLNAVSRSDWPTAITKFSTALATSANPAWLIGRSKALLGTGRAREALEDADLAWHMASQRNKRELMIEAQHRRAVAYNRLGELANADCCCFYAIQMLQGVSVSGKKDIADEYTDSEGRWTVTLDQVREENKDRDAKAQEADAKKKEGGTGLLEPSSAAEKQQRATGILRLQILGKLDKLPADDPGRKRTVTVSPPKRELSKLKDEKPKQDIDTEKTESSGPLKASTSGPAPPVDNTPKVQDFQSQATMNVSIFSKGVDKSKLQVDFSEFGVRLDPIVYPNGEEKSYTISTWGRLDPAACKYTVTPSKVELQLKKAEPGKWPILKSENGTTDAPKATQSTGDVQAQSTDSTTTKRAPEEENKSKTADDATSTKPADAAPSSVASRSGYPTSSRSGPKNWDNVEFDSEEDESDVNGFFKKLFKNATPEQQRAMMKSFTESSGTSLSTDWDDVKARTVDAVPPEGVEAKKWS